MPPQRDPLMWKMNQTIFTEHKCGSSHPPRAASEPIRAAAHAHHSISAGLELIKVSISDNPCLYAALHSIRALAFVVFSPYFLFCLISPRFGVWWSGNTNTATLVPSRQRGENCKDWITFQKKLAVTAGLHCYRCNIASKSSLLFSLSLSHTHNCTES